VSNDHHAVIGHASWTAAGKSVHDDPGMQVLPRSTNRAGCMTMQLRPRESPDHPPNAHLVDI
jgi:hypothetical protein